jgi:hypothetical protein
MGHHPAGKHRKRTRDKVGHETLLLLEAIDRAEKAIKDLRSTTRNDRKAFAVYLLRKKRR